MTTLFDEGLQGNQEVALDDFAQDRRWVAWCQEYRTDKQGNKQLTKKPYSASGRPASSTDPATWTTRADAERGWERLRGGAVDGVGGTGIMLGELPNGSHLAGLDLDHCINAKTNKIEAWACEIVDRFDTYAEVSPSGLGIKAFFIVDATDVAQVEMLLGRQMGKAFKADARTGIEFYLGSRYFAVTDDRLDDATPETLRTVTVDDVRWLLQEAVPAFLAKHGKPQAAKGRDQTGSGFGFRFFGQRKRAGDSFEETREGVQADDGPAGDWARTRADERQFQRAWDRQKANSTEEDTRPLVARSIDSSNGRSCSGCGPRSSPWAWSRC